MRDEKSNDASSAVRIFRAVGVCSLLSRRPLIELCQACFATGGDTATVATTGAVSTVGEATDAATLADAAALAAARAARILNGKDAARRIPARAPRPIRPAIALAFNLEFLAACAVGEII